MWTKVRRRVLTGELSKRAACRESGITMVKEAVREWEDVTEEVFVPLSQPPREPQVTKGFQRLQTLPVRGTVLSRAAGR